MSADDHLIRLSPQRLRVGLLPRSTSSLSAIARTASLVGGKPLRSWSSVRSTITSSSALLSFRPLASQSRRGSLRRGGCGGYLGERYRGLQRVARSKTRFFLRACIASLILTSLEEINVWCYGCIASEGRWVRFWWSGAQLAYQPRY